MAANKALRFQRLIFGLVLDAAQRLERRHVVGRLKNSPEQHRNVFEFHPGTFFNAGNGDFSQISVRTAEIELELDFHGTYHRSFSSAAGVIFESARHGPIAYAGDARIYSSKIELSILAGFLPFLYVRAEPKWVVVSLSVPI